MRQKREKTLIRLGENLRVLRGKKLLSQEKLAELSGVHRNFVGLIERGEREVGIQKLIQIAKALRAEPSEIFKGIL